MISHASEQRDPATSSLHRHHHLRWIDGERDRGHQVERIGFDAGGFGDARFDRLLELEFVAFDHDGQRQLHQRRRKRKHFIGYSEVSLRVGAEW